MATSTQDRDLPLTNLLAVNHQPTEVHRRTQWPTTFIKTIPRDGMNPGRPTPVGQFTDQPATRIKDGKLDAA